MMKSTLYRQEYLWEKLREQLRGTRNHRYRYIDEDSHIERVRTDLPIYLILKITITVGNPLWPQPLPKEEEWE